MSPSNFGEGGGRADDASDTETPQLPQNQQEDFITDIDTLPDGRCAFDLALSPAKPPVPKPEPVVIELRNLLPKDVLGTPPQT